MISAFELTRQRMNLFQPVFIVRIDDVVRTHFPGLLHAKRIPSQCDHAGAAVFGIDDRPKADEADSRDHHPVVLPDIHVLDAGVGATQ